MAYVIQTKETIKSKLQSYFEIAGFSNVASGTPEHALLNIMTDNIYEIYTYLGIRYNEVLPLNAEGTTLDLWADFFGSTRSSANYAMDNTTSNIFFSVADGNRLLVNEGAEFIIASGVIISANGLKKYRTTSDATIPEYGSAPYAEFVGVEAVELGPSSNVAAGEFNTHNLSDVYPDVAAIDLVEVSNKFAITSGSYPETDTMVQTNLQDLFEKNIGNNIQGIIASIFALPGVSNVSMLTAKRGTGTFSMFVDSVAPVVSLSLIQQVQEEINAIKALGVTGYVEYPVYNSIRICFNVIPVAGKSSEELLATLQGSTVQAIVNLINNTGRGSNLNVDALTRIVMDNSNVLNFMPNT